MHEISQGWWAIEQSKIIRWSESPWNQSGKKKVYGGKDLLKSKVLSSEWNTERVREGASCDSEDGEDDKLAILNTPQIPKILHYKSHFCSQHA